MDQNRNRRTPVMENRFIVIAFDITHKPFPLGKLCPSLDEGDFGSLMFKFETTIARVSKAIAEIINKKPGIMAASGLDFAHRRHRVHDLGRASLAQVASNARHKH